MTVTGLFAGIGGIELAFRQAGFETNLLVENDTAARAVLEARFPDTELHADVLDLTDIPANTTILTAGFPCQNLSMAGDKSGINGTKSGVVWKLFDLIARSRTPLIVIENVYFMLQLDSGNGMLWLVEQFERLGYRWAYRILDTMGFGLPQRRRRVYFIASLDTDPRAILFADETSSVASPKPNLKKPLGFYWTEGRSGVGFTMDGVPPLKVGSGLGIPSAPAVLFSDGEVLSPSLPACELLQGFTPGWTTASASRGDKRNPEWSMIGNAVSVPVARWIADRIKSPGTLLDFQQAPLSDGARWPNAAFNVGKGRQRIDASDKPVSIACPSITQFRDRTWTRLSERALNGFIRRATEGNLRMPEGFLDALKSAPRKLPSGRKAMRRTDVK